MGPQDLCVNKHRPHPTIVIPLLGPQVPADAGREKGPREVLEASDPANGLQSSQHRRPHHLHQRH